MDALTMGLDSVQLWRLRIFGLRLAWKIFSVRVGDVSQL